MTLLEQLEGALQSAQDELTERKKTLDEAHERVMGADDKADVEALKRTFDEADTAFDEAREERDRCKKNYDAQVERDAVVAANVDLPRTPAHATARGGKTEEVYRPDGDFQFFRDAYNHRYNADPEALQRLHVHGRAALDSGVLKRDVGTGAFAGLTVPQYLIDLFAPYARAGRPYANSIRSATLPSSGMTIHVSRATTGTATAVQATENSAVQETDFDDTDLTIDVRTVAGQQDVSRQALERSENVDTIVYADLVSAYHTELDRGILNDAGTSGTHLGFRQVSGIVAVTYTDASPTVPEAYPKLMDLLQQINAGRYLPATAIWMHPRRWAWFLSALDTTNRPLVVPVAPVNPVGVGKAAEYGQVVGQVAGLPVITDANIIATLGASTNEDLILAARADDHILWEEGDGMPRRLRFEETQGGSLTVKLVVYGYAAYTAGRYPLAGGKIGGTGLTAPTF